MAKKKPFKETVDDELEQIALTMCKKYCKYSMSANGIELITSDKFNEWCDKVYKHCEKCPMDQFIH